jgi:hypothetical protein
LIICEKASKFDAKFLKNGKAFNFIKTYARDLFFWSTMFFNLFNGSFTNEEIKNEDLVLFCALK